MAKAVFRIEHRLGIPAPAHAIWQVLSDLESWREWNALYPHCEGKLGYGAELKVTEQLPGFEPVVLAPTVIEWGPDSHIHWRTSQSWGFLKRVRYFEIDPLSDEGCIFANGEDWYGRQARYVPPARRRAMREAYEAMGEALKARVAATWRAEERAPTSAQP